MEHTLEKTRGKKRKKGWSVKRKLTLWCTGLMGVLAVLVLGFMFAISSAVASRTSMDQLSQTLRDNLALADMTDGRLTVDTGFRFTHNGVYTIVYSKAGALLAGQSPVTIPPEESFDHGRTRTLSIGDSRYYLLDFWRPIGWESGFWVRGLLEVPENQLAEWNLLLVTGLFLPVFLALAAAGSFWIAKRAFRPLELVTQTAGEIHQGADLSRRLTASGIDTTRQKDEFSKLAATFDRMFQRLEESFETEKRFAADASHELRTPVSIIRAACESALMFEESPEERRETLEIIQRQGEKMTELIEGLLSLTRMELGTLAPVLEPVNLTEFVSTLCGEYPPATPLLSRPDPAVWGQGDKKLLSVLLKNLIDNALKYSGPQGSCEVTLSKGIFPPESTSLPEGKEKSGEKCSQERILLCVSDNGPGIDPAHMEHLWQRFYQAEPSRTGEKGVGLGLSLVRQIALLHQAQVHCQSTPGQGTRFIVAFPLSCSKLLKKEKKGETT